MTIVLKPIGYVSAQDQQSDGILRPSSQGRIHLDPQYREGLSGLSAGMPVQVLFHFHLSDGYALTTLSRKSQVMTGVFNTHSPQRPNGIGETIVRIDSIEGGEIAYTGGDMLDGTPVLDIKPWNPSLGNIKA